MTGSLSIERRCRALRDVALLRAESWARGNAICIQPLLLDDVGGGTCAADGEGGVDGIDQAWLFARLREYLAAFFWGSHFAPGGHNEAAIAREV